MVSADIAVLTILGIAALRGIFLGVIRELCSVLGLITACLAVRFLSADATAFFLQQTGLAWPELAVRSGCGVLIAIATLFIVAKLGQLLQRGAQAAGLNWADRTAGGLLGTAEGLLVAGILLVCSVIVLGKEHRLVANSYSLVALERVEKIAAIESPTLPSVASPPADSKSRSEQQKSSQQ